MQRELLHAWERLAQLVRCASTKGALRSMAEAIFSMDRGYITKQIFNFFRNVPGASILRTQKRDLAYPFVFGSGPITIRAIWNGRI